MSISQIYSLFLASNGITTDTRDCPAGSLFFALRGETFDGNQFALQALEKGCSYAVVDDAALPQDERLILVDDVLETLQALAAYHRKQLGTPVLQITGTNGKTTTKELTAAVLSRKFNVLYTQGNLNNHIGVPRTLLQLRPEHTFAVIETGANHPGEIRTLTNIVQPDYALITNVGRAHLEGFGSFEGVKRTKGELYDYFRANKPEAKIFLNADSEDLREMAHNLHTVNYGTASEAYDVQGEVVSCAPFLRLRWRERGGEWHDVQTRLIGAYNIYNALAAATVGLSQGVPAADISAALADYEPTNNRSELKRTERNVLIVDAYNANPTSMEAALQNFELIEHPHKVAILGAMKELGEVSAAEHAKVVARLQAMPLEQVLLVGEEYKSAENPFPVFADIVALTSYLDTHPLADKLILVKGSNSTRLYKLPEIL